jgi:hypothetical protein
MSGILGFECIGENSLGKFFGKILGKFWENSLGKGAVKRGCENNWIKEYNYFLKIKSSPITTP